MVDIGGRRLALREAGEGSPTVVLEAGMGCGLDVWDRVLEPVAQFTKICAYDRAGLGASDQAPTPRTCAGIVEDLEHLLEGTGMLSPYVLVGHSFGGLCVRLYAHRYPCKVAGMVLVDPTHEEQWDLGLALLPPEEPGEPEEITKRRRFHTEGLNDPSVNPEGVLNGESSEQMRVAGSLGTMPLVVITADRPDGAPYAAMSDPVARHDMLWADLRRTLHGRLVQLSERSAHVWARRSGHMVPDHEPEVIVEAVRQVVEAVRARGGSSHANESLSTT